MNEVIGGRNRVQPPHLRRPFAGLSEPGDPGLTHQDSDETLADPNANPEGQLGVDAPRPVGLPGGGVDLPNQTGEPWPAHLRRRHRPLLVLALAGAADPDEEAAELGPMTGLDESVDHRVNPFGLGRSSPNSLDAFFKIVTSSSSCRMRFFAFASSILSGVVIPGRSPRSIWSCRTQL